MTREEKIRQHMQKRWSDPSYRKKMIERQKHLGFRTYNSSYVKKEDNTKNWGTG